MKKVILLLSAILLVTNFLHSQARHKSQIRGFGNGRLAEFEKIKLLETLDLDEEAAAKFIVRRNQHLEKQRELSQKREAAINELRDVIESGLTNAEQLQKKNNEILEYEELLLKSRREFLESLKDIMDAEKISKVLVFEYVFRQEIQNELKSRKRSER